MFLAEQLEFDFFSPVPQREVLASTLTEQPSPVFTKTAVLSNPIYRWLLNNTRENSPADQFLLKEFENSDTYVSLIKQSDIFTDPEKIIDSVKAIFKQSHHADEATLNNSAEAELKNRLFWALRDLHSRSPEEINKDVVKELSDKLQTSDKALEEAKERFYQNHPTVAWIRELPNKVPALHEPAEKILTALTPEVIEYLQNKNPSYYSPVENRFSLENHFKSCCELMRNGKTLDEKGNSLLVRAAALRILTNTAFYISQNAEVFKQSDLTQADVDAFFEAERKTDNEFYKHRDSLKHNKDGSLKLEDFGEDLNNTRKGRSSGKSSSPNRFLYEPITEIEKRLAAEPLDKLWPKDSLIELHKTNPEAAACLWLVRDKISGRKPPKTSYKYRSYLNTASAAIALHRQVLTGELAPEAQVKAFDYFYFSRDEAKIFALIDTKFWNIVSPGLIENAKNICRWNGLTLSDGTDINGYLWQCCISAKETEEHPHALCFIDRKGSRIPVFAVITAHGRDEFKEKLNHQLSVSFGRLLQADNTEVGKEQPSQKKVLPITFLGRGNRQTHTYEIYGKQGTIELQLTDKMTFESDDEFWKYVASHRAELEGKYAQFRSEYSKSEKDWRSTSPIRERKGPDYRGGKDASPEMFQNTFGFRGVEFGNWVKQGKNGRERQWMLNNAYDSLYDLSKILNIPPKAVALNGDLGLCFGSRGFGSASAHYEPENRIINLTKTKGYSSLAHEWFHALDHHLARNLYEAKLFEGKFLSDQAEPVRYGLSEAYKEKLRKQIESYSKTPDAVVNAVERTIVDNPMFVHVINDKSEEGERPFELDVETKHSAWKDGHPLTYTIRHQITKNDLREIPFEHDKKLRSEVFHAWGETIEAIRSSSMHKRMRKKNAYWQSKIEEAARSFEAFVEIRSKELGIQNDFLTNGAFSEQEVGKNSFYPYLDGKDVNTVKEKFQKLFDAVKTRDTDKGVELYSKTREKKTGATVSEIQTALEKKFGKKAINQLLDSQMLAIISNKNELKEHLIGHALLESKRNAARTVYRSSIGGLYSSTEKKSFLIANSISPENAPAVLLHEVGIHMAFDSALRNKVKPLIEQAPQLLEEGFFRRDPVCMAAGIRLKDAGITKDHPNYAEETAAYLIEECERQHSQQPAIVRWASEFKSAVNVWLIEHNFRSVKELTVQDYVTVTKTNIKTLATNLKLQDAFDKSVTPHFSLNKQHQEILKTLKETLPKNNSALRNTNLLKQVLNEVKRQIYECEKNGEVFRFKEDLAVQHPLQKQRKETPKFVFRKNNNEYERCHQR